MTGILRMIENLIKWATLTDLKGKNYNQTFKDLENYQNTFFSIQRKVFDENYIWPLRPLYEWSRRVEYPFVVNVLPNKRGLNILDAGSAVTFFPYYLAEELDHHVECLDNQEKYCSLIENVSNLIGMESRISYQIADLTEKLPYNDQVFDIVMCISVIEHLPERYRINALSELWRLLKSGGKFIVTVDVSLRDKQDEGIPITYVENFMKQVLDKLNFPPVNIPKIPHDILTPQKPGYSFRPIIIGNQIIRGGIKGLLYDLLKNPLPCLPPLACLLISLDKP